MATKIKYAAIAIILLGALTLILSYFCGWNNINALNVGAYAIMIAGLVGYIIAGKKELDK